MEKEKGAVVNVLPAPTYRFLKVNESRIAVPDAAGALGAWRVKGQLPAGAELAAVSSWSALPESIRGIATGMGAAIDGVFAERGIGAAVLRIPENAHIQEPLVLPVNVSCSEAMLASLVVHAKAGSDLTVIVDITGGGEGCANAKGFFGLSTKIRAERGARVHLVHVQRFGASITGFDDIGGFCEEGAAIELTTLALGSRGAAKGNEGNFIGARVTLAGDGSSFVNRTGYYCGGQTSLDMNFVADQRGKGTTSEMVFRGVLDDHAAKIWRGTIDFKSGSAGSAGDEQEDTLMLSPYVRNSSVPVILCAEEDVDGRHGASIGQLSEEILFYMRSRGYTEEEARRLIVQARLKSIAREIPESKLRWEIEQWIEREIA